MLEKWVRPQPKFTNRLLTCLLQKWSETEDGLKIPRGQSFDVMPKKRYEVYQNRAIKIDGCSKWDIFNEKINLSNHHLEDFEITVPAFKTTEHETRIGFEGIGDGDFLSIEIGLLTDDGDEEFNIPISTPHIRLRVNEVTCAQLFKIHTELTMGSPEEGVPIIFYKQKEGIEL